MKKRIKLEEKANLAPPMPVDEIAISSVNINFEMGTLEIHTILIDGDGGEGGQPIIVGRRPVVMGLNGAGFLKRDELEQAAVSEVLASGIFPDGGEVEP